MPFPRGVLGRLWGPEGVRPVATSGQQPGQDWGSPIPNWSLARINQASTVWPAQGPSAVGPPLAQGGWRTAVRWSLTLGVVQTYFTLFLVLAEPCCFRLCRHDSVWDRTLNPVM